MYVINIIGRASYMYGLFGSSISYKWQEREQGHANKSVVSEIEKSQYTLHVPCLLGNQNTPWHVIFWYFHKHVLLLACPPALVTSDWLQQSPFMSWLCLLHFVWLTSGLCLPAGHGLTLSSTSLPGRPANEVNVPPSRVRGWHLGLYNALCHLPRKTTEKTDIMNQLGQYRAAVRFLLKCYSWNTNCMHFHFFNMPLAEKWCCQILARAGILLEEFVCHQKVSDPIQMRLSSMLPLKNKLIPPKQI